MRKVGFIISPGYQPMGFAVTAPFEVDAVRYNGTIHDFMLLNALRHEPSTEAAIEQANEGVRLHLSVVSN
jgi:acetyl esterase